MLIYWTVETGGSMAIYSQHLTCSASEVHAMVEGAMRHETNMTVETNYVDSHGASIIGFGVTRLLNIERPAGRQRRDMTKGPLLSRTHRDPSKACNRKASTSASRACSCSRVEPAP